MDDEIDTWRRNAGYLNQIKEQPGKDAWSLLNNILDDITKDIEKQICNTVKKFITYNKKHHIGLSLERPLKHNKEKHEEHLNEILETGSR